MLNRFTYLLIYPIDHHENKTILFITTLHKSDKFDKHGSFSTSLILHNSVVCKQVQTLQQLQQLRRRLGRLS